jgi:hypothetical protein
MTCPHCQAPLPEASTFCAACGRRIEGWQKTPNGAASSSPLPGGEEPTRQMEPTPSLLRAAAVSKKKGPTPSGPVETESAMMRAYKSNKGIVIAIFSLIAVGAAAVTYFVVRKPAPVEPPKVAEAPTTAPPEVTPPAPPAVAKKRRKRGPHREEPMTVEKIGKPGQPAKTPAPSKPIAKVDSGGALPRKKVETDSKPVATNNSHKPPPEDLPNEAVPLTEEEMKQQAEASIDADGVRFVVKQHMPQVRACYERAFKESSPGGRVEIAFAIGPDGLAKRVRTDENTTGSDQLGKCLEQKVKEWTFPRPVGGDYELIYPFVFQGG